MASQSSQTKFNIDNLNDLDNLNDDMIKEIIKTIEVNDLVNLISIYDRIGKFYFINVTDAEKWGFFIIILMFKEVKRFLRQEVKTPIARKYSLYTINSKTNNKQFFKTIAIYVNLKSCGCIITRENKSVSDKNIDIHVTELFFWNVGRYSKESLINNQYVCAKLSMKWDPELLKENLQENLQENLLQYFMQLFFTHKESEDEDEDEDKDQKPKAKYQLYDSPISTEAHVFDVMKRHMFLDEDKNAFINGNYISYYADKISKEDILNEIKYDSSHDKLLDCQDITSLFTQLQTTEYNKYFTMFLVQFRSQEKHALNLEKLWDSRMSLYTFFGNENENKQMNLNENEQICALEYFSYFLYNGTSIEDIMYTIDKWQTKSWSQPSIAGNAGNIPKIPKIKDDNVISLASYYNYYEDYRYRLDLAFYDNGGIMIWNPQIGIISKEDGTRIINENVVKIVSDDIILKSFEEWNKTLESKGKSTFTHINSGVFYLPKIMHKQNETSGGSSFYHLQNKYSKYEQWRL